MYTASDSKYKLLEVVLYICRSRPGPTPRRRWIGSGIQSGILSWTSSRILCLRRLTHGTTVRIPEEWKQVKNAIGSPPAAKTENSLGRLNSSVTTGSCVSVARRRILCYSDEQLPRRLCQCHQWALKQEETRSSGTDVSPRHQYRELAGTDSAGTVVPMECDS